MRISEEWGRPAEPAGPVDADVLIPTCDRPAELAVTLAGLAAQAGPSFSVIVSDQSGGQAAWLHPAPGTRNNVIPDTFSDNLSAGYAVGLGFTEDIP